MDQSSEEEKVHSIVYGFNVVSSKPSASVHSIWSPILILSPKAGKGKSVKSPISGPWPDGSDML